jgi:hypothetical protein
MARKRRLEVPPSDDEVQEDKNGPDVRTDRDIAIEGTWKEWFQKVFLKYCYAVGILILACFVPLEMLRQFDGDLGLGVAFLMVLLIVPLGFFCYLKLWGDGGVWGSGSSDEL